MKTKMYKLSDRRNYSLFIIPHGEDTMEFLERNYPFKVIQKNLFIAKNKNQSLCYIFNDITAEENRILSSRYVLNRNRKYSGKIFARTDEFTEELLLDDGKLVSDRLVSQNEIEKDKKVYVFKNSHEADINDILHRVTKNEILKKTILMLLSLIFILSLTLIFIRGIGSAVNKRNEEKRKIQEINKLKEMEAQKDNDELVKLKNEYEKKVIVSNKKIYPVINMIYENIGSKSLINSLSIQKNSFSLDLTANNSLEILSKFESDRNIANIAINRTANDSGQEIVSFTGEVKNTFEQPPENSSVKEKIGFYKNLLKEESREIVFSEYAKDVRRLIKECSCVEEYMQIKNNNDFIDLECSIRGNGSNILRLVKNIDVNERKMEIKSIRIKNNKKSAFCNADIIFETFIDVHAAGLKDLENIVYVEKTPDEIGKVFNNSGNLSGGARVSQSRSSSPKKISSSKVVTIETAKKSPEKLEYIGKGSNEDYSKIIFVKSPVTGLIYKVPVVSGAINGDFAFEHSDKYQVFVGKVEYEVKK